MGGESLQRTAAGSHRAVPCARERLMPELQTLDRVKHSLEGPTKQLFGDLLTGN